VTASQRTFCRAKLGRLFKLSDSIFRLCRSLGDAGDNTTHRRLCGNTRTGKDKTAVEQMRLIQQLDDDDKQTIFKLIDKMLTNKKFKDFFAKNVAML